MTDWTTTKITAELVRGAIELEDTGRGLLPHRLPAWARAQIPDVRLTIAEAQPAGMRLVFRTDATTLELDTLQTKRVYVGAPEQPPGTFTLVVDGRVLAHTSVPGGNTLLVDPVTVETELRPGSPGVARFPELPAGAKTVEIWLPHNEQTELLALRTDAPVEPVRAERPVWLHHGSSISHGSNADGPTTTWPAVAARAAGVDLINLGFSGNALLDPFVARTLRDTPADVISMKIGINLTNGDLMRLRAFTPAVHGFLDTIREGRPDTPLVLVSPLYCPIQEDTPGPVAMDTEALARGDVQFIATGDPDEVAAGKLTLRVIRDELTRIVEQRSDPHLSYVDGLHLYGPADYDELPLPDGLHPDTAAHRRIADRFVSTGVLSTDRSLQG